MAGAIKTLYQMLASSSFLSGVSLVYGEEQINGRDYTYPAVVMVPTRGDINNQPGYIKDLDPSVEMVWGITETIDLYLVAFSSLPNAQPIDHADAVETLRQQVLSALQDQRAQFTDVVNVSYGLYYKANSERWDMYQNAQKRYGRSLVLTVTAEISVPMATPASATITSETISVTVTE